MSAQHANHGQRSDVTLEHDSPSRSFETKPGSNEDAGPIGTASFPRLSNSSPTIPKQDARHLRVDEEDEELTTPTSFPRSTSPTSTGQRNRGAQYRKVGEEGICKMHRFSLYETTTRFYFVGGDIQDKRFRILKIDRTTDSEDLSVTEDDIVYTKKEMNQLLNAVDDGNKVSGGLKLKCSTWGLLGFIRFTSAFYMLLITKRSQVAVIGGHYIYQVDGTELISLNMPSSSRFKNFDPEEGRFVSVLNNLDLSRSFYFSYSYDITRTLQVNILRERLSLHKGQATTSSVSFNSMFVWNHHLLAPAEQALRNTYDWCVPLIHGFVDQATLSIYGRTVHVAIIARRSRFFAGARFLKRGANDLGYVANDVETEQIVSEMLTTSFHAPGPILFGNPHYTSYVQHRGSIPLYWTQDNSGVSPKPGIDLNLVDPFYTAAALHFDNLFDRYGSQIYVLNLVKARERTPRESILLKEYTCAITYLNQFLPLAKKIKYRAWDMSRASKSRDQDVIGTLESIAEDAVETTGFFQNGWPESGTFRLQNGVVRTNCIDCLDRTNAAQFVIGKRALGHQLHALGIIDQDSIDYDTDAVNLFTHMYHDHGDTIAIQYGGSHLVNTMETYRKINQWTSHSRDMVESFKRYYNNSFLDKQRQEAYNLFLGNYIYVQGQPMLWDLSTDYYLHHAHPRSWIAHTPKRYSQWYSPEHLDPQRIPDIAHGSNILGRKSLNFFDDYWLEYYRPLALSSFTKIFSFKMNSTLRYVPFKSTQEGKYDLSPFRVRDGHDQQTPDKGHPRKEVKIVDPQNEASKDKSEQLALDGTRSESDALPGWLRTQLAPPRGYQSILKGPLSADAKVSEVLNTPKEKKTFKDKAAITQWTLQQFFTNSLNPSVTSAEAREYQRYIDHPLNLALVVSTDIPPDPSAELVNYVKSVTSDAVASLSTSDDDLADFTEFLDIGDNPLTVAESDSTKKRYKAYRQWVKGKSLFKQRLEP
ncbi:uncharacterized protein KY384_007610 [Bacidia gigantensis]|uniref:uncharacterized protein n=1 Tax=Bacidia gigantensis TaxID=2732470 RepID=UPI001D03772A|nr:uncharacterized protein KY384_007610 [Bacidia gigantensis]KAG8527458.1 hypothetical protein KY384_007610 [Bacidia gigantensis]